MPKSEKRNAANRANAMKPRTPPLPEERGVRQLARLDMVTFLCTEAKEGLKEGIRDTVAKKDWDTFAVLFKAAADKFGLPTVTESTVNFESGAPKVLFEFKGIPKPGSEVASEGR